KTISPASKWTSASSSPRSVMTVSTPVLRASSRSWSTSWKARSRSEPSIAMSTGLHGGGADPLQRPTRLLVLRIETQDPAEGVRRLVDPAAVEEERAQLCERPEVRRIDREEVGQHMDRFPQSAAPALELREHQRRLAVARHNGERGAQLGGALIQTTHLLQHAGQGDACGRGIVVQLGRPTQNDFGVRELSRVQERAAQLGEDGRILAAEVARPLEGRNRIFRPAR